MNPDVITRADELNRVMADNAALVEALEMYGEHHRDCDWKRTDCTCGLYADHPGAALLSELDSVRRERDEAKARMNDTIEQWDRANAIRRKQKETIDRMTMFVQQALDRANRFLEADSPIPFEALDDIADDMRIALKESNDA